MINSSVVPTQLRGLILGFVNATCATVNCNVRPFRVGVDNRDCDCVEDTHICHVMNNILSREIRSVETHRVSDAVRTSLIISES